MLLMKKFDTYDLVLEMLGYKFQKDEIPESLLENNMDAILELTDKLKIPLKDSIYELILLNDDVNDMMHVVLALYEIIGLDNENCMRLMKQAHVSGAAAVARGSRKRIQHMQKRLTKRNLKAVIKKQTPTMNE